MLFLAEADQYERRRVVPTIRTTDGAIALLNLQAQIDGLERQVRINRLPSDRRADLVELLLLRGHLLGQIADYERADTLAEQLVRDAPDQAIAYVARARTGGTFHRFAESLADLDRAERCGTDPVALASDRASALNEPGHADEALTLIESVVDRGRDGTALGTLAVLYAERGERAMADDTFSRARTRYRGVSPFPIAMLDFQRGRMWFEQAEPGLARLWLDAACRRVPSYMPALGHLAEVEAELGETEVAIARLRPLASPSDDPDYAAQLARILTEAGETAEAERWRCHAARRYDELVDRHPAAYADHAAEFWLGVGRNPFRAVDLAHQNVRCRPTPRSWALLQRALAQATGPHNDPTRITPAPGADDA